MRICRQCNAVRTAPWEAICHDCIPKVDNTAFILWAGQPSLRYRVTRFLAFIAIVAVSYFVLRYLIAPPLGFVVTLIGGDLGRALGDAVSLELGVAYVLGACVGTCIMWSELRGKGEPSFHISKTKIETTLIRTSKESGIAITNWEDGLHRITSIEVDHAWLGKLLNYGTVILRRGASKLDRFEFSGVASPVQMKEKIQRLLNDLSHDPQLMAISQAVPLASGVPGGREEKKPPSRFRFLRYALVAFALVALPTYCNMKLRHDTETMHPGERREVALFTDTIVMPASGRPAFQWEPLDANAITVQTFVEKAERSELIESVEIGVRIGEVSLIEIGSGGKAIRIDFTATLNVRPTAPTGDIDFLVVFQHPKFVYPPVVGGELRKRVRVKIVAGGGG
jgi:hypothetical protein